MGSQARVTQYQHPVFIRYTISYNSNGASTGIVFGHAPAGARVQSTHLWVETAGNGTTPTVSVGYIPEMNGLLTAAVSAQTQLVSGQTTAAAGQFSIAPAGTNGIFGTDMALVASIGGTGATAGVVTIGVTYLPNL